MPFVISNDADADIPDRGPVRLRLILTPYKSLTPEGFVWFIGVTSALIFMPLLSFLGTSVFWGLLPFVCAALYAIWRALKRSWSDMDLYEELTLWDDLVRIERHDPRKPPRDWEANPYWVRVSLHEKGGPVPNYLTLSGAGREVELGAFLTPGERMRLRDLLEANFRAA
ncbi:DUF2244 domain-containing protein [Rhodobacterales bacterium HKCCE3408]|nr:DUF2244 domain-containing protein [Rhodobacterales bacterium HKCCE3408]